MKASEPNNPKRTRTPLILDKFTSVIIAARNEESYIVDCLNSLLAQDSNAGMLDVIVAANACTDDTAGRALSCLPDFEQRGWELRVIDVPEPGKINALNRGNDAANGTAMIYLDADVRCDPALIGQLRQALASELPLYATGTLKVAPARSWFTRQYARFWQLLPFVRSGAVGAGLFAVNQAGRQRWQAFPDIISDDTFIRLQFQPSERIEVPAHYHWPMIEGFRNLVRVRKRQDDGVNQIGQLYPDILKNDQKAGVRRSDLRKLLFQDPVGFCVYAAVHFAVRLKRSDTDWTRGR